ncbi:disulfide bond formation protein DsbC [Stenotrophomonas sp. KAs 5-3]|nr:disulfide bond formation protein DsbC [Stenotrophomonas sp. KAs 5-3]
MARHGTLRARPAELLPGTVRVISVGMDYSHKDDTEAWATLADPGRAYVARYALGRDYHKLIKVDYIGAAPFPGFREVVVSGQLLYVSDDGRYLFQSQPYDTRAKGPANSEGLLGYRRDLLAKANHGDRIVFAAPNAKYTISVFTDIECGYCRKLHQDIAELNRNGISVEYLAFPRMGLGSKDYTDMISVWCAADRRQALTNAKRGGSVPAKNCTNPVAMQYALGQQLGVNGTPAIFAPDGTQLGGYLPPAQLRAALEKLSAKR